MSKIIVSSSFVCTLIIPVFLILLAQVDETTTKSVEATTSKIDGRDKVSYFILHEEDVSFNKAMTHKTEDTGEWLNGGDKHEVSETGRAKNKYSYYYLARSVLYFVLYYQLFYNFYFLAHVVRSAFLHRVNFSTTSF